MRKAELDLVDMVAINKRNREHTKRIRDINFWNASKKGTPKSTKKRDIKFW